MNTRLVYGISLIAPFAAALALVPFRDQLASTNAALILVVIVVGVSSLGQRLAGLVTALSAGLWFDAFLTRPYGRLSIDDPADVETAALLLIVGLAVAELATWGRRQQAAASRADGYTAGIAAAAASVSDDAPPAVLIEQVRPQLVQLLQAESCRFDYGRGVLGGRHPRLRSDGEVEVDGAICDIERYGLPVQQEIEILLVASGRYMGRFVVQARHGSHPSLAQRLVAVTLADRAASALAAGQAKRSPEKA